MIDAHRGAFEYDWRARFRVPLRAIGRSMSWGEAYRLTQALAVDPSSSIGAALNGWDHPLSRDAMATMDLFDLSLNLAWQQGGKKGPKPKPYPRPWSQQTTSRTAPTVSHDEILAALRMAGHHGPIPDRPPV